MRRKHHRNMDKSSVAVQSGAGAARAALVGIAAIKRGIMHIFRAGAGKRAIAVATLGLALSACSGGGSGSPTPTPTTSNRAPTITSAASFSVVENSTAAVYQASATDAD